MTCSSIRIQLSSVVVCFIMILTIRRSALTYSGNESPLQPQSPLSCTCRCTNSLFGSILASPCKICGRLRATGQSTLVFSCQYHSLMLCINLHLNSTVIRASRQSLEIFEQINAVSDIREYWIENYIHTVSSVLKFNIILSSMHSS